ncbi:MAG: acetolactate decarboxylase [Phycisphaerae bacterium]
MMRQLTQAKWIMMMLTALGLIGGCQPTSRVHVGAFRTWGEMREVMRDGRTQPRIRLTEIAKANVFGLGALAGLAGEVTIHEGQIWVSQVREGRVHTEIRHDPEDHATLLAAFSMDQWRNVELNAEMTLSELEDFIAEARSLNGYAPDMTMPFMLVGTFEADVHVVNGACPHADASAPAYRFKIAGDHATAVGYFVENAEGRLTHHGARTHIHAFVTDPSRQMGHVDAITVRPPATLLIPYE